MIFIVTPVKNNSFYTKQFLRSLERQDYKEPFGIVIVNNGSTDDTASYLDEWKSKEDNRYVVTNVENHGYAGGCNDGMRFVLGLFPDADILITNNDMEFFPNTMSELIKAKDLLDTKEAGIIGARLLFSDGRIQHAGAAIGPYGWGQHKLAGAFSKDIEEYNPIEQEYVTGAFFFIYNKVFKTMTQEPLFDERFNPAYFEEVDYCTTARQYGFKTFYVPSIVAIHYETKTSMDVFKDRTQVQQLSDTNQVKFYLKHDYGEEDYQSNSDRRALICGKIYGDWSFSIVLRNLALGLKRNGVDVSIAPEEYHQTLPMDDWEIKEMILKPNDYWNRVVLRSSEGDHQYLMPPGRKRVAHTTFEGTRLHKGWIDQLNHVDQIVTNSSYCMNKMRAHGIETPIAIVPNPVDTKLFHPNAKPMKMEGKRRFGFLVMSAFGERKNLEGAIRAFIEEFGPQEDVFMSVHSLSLFFILQENKLDVKTWISNFIMKGNTKEHAPLYVTSNSFLPALLPSFIVMHDCFVMPSKCEGFGNGLIEAGACGIPSIGTYYSGMTDFLDDEVGFPLRKFTMEKMPLQKLPYYRNYIGSEWAIVDIADLRAKMRFAFENQAEVKRRGKNARIKSEGYDIVAVGDKLAKAMFD